MMRRTAALLLALSACEAAEVSPPPTRPPGSGPEAPGPGPETPGATPGVGPEAGAPDGSVPPPGCLDGTCPPSCPGPSACTAPGATCEADVAVTCAVGAQGCLERASAPCTFGCESGACASGCRVHVYAADQRVLAWLEGRGVYSSAGVLLGWIDRDRTRFADGRPGAARVGDDFLRPDGRLLASLRGTTLYASDGSVAAFLGAGVIRAADGSVAAFVTDPGTCQTSRTELLSLVAFGLVGL